MRSTEQFSITLPKDMAKHIQNKVESGNYASVSEVLREGVRALMAREEAMEKWLRQDVVAGHNEYLSDPSKAIPAKDILAKIKSKQ